MKAEGMQEPQVIMDWGSGGMDGIATWTKGPVEVTLYQDHDAEDPREWSAGDASEAIKAWDAGDVFMFMLTYHDGEGDALCGLYGWDYAEQAAEEALEDGWKRYVEDCERVTAWAHDMGRTLAGTWITTGVPA